jgi:hypothetical protein
MSGASGSQFERGVPGDILKPDRSLSFTRGVRHQARTVGVINGESSRRLAFFLLQPQWLAAESAAWWRRRALPLLPLLLNTAKVKVHRGDEVEEPDPGIINNLVCRRLNAPPSRVRLRSHELISRPPFPG